MDSELIELVGNWIECYLKLRDSSSSHRGADVCILTNDSGRELVHFKGQSSGALESDGLQGHKEWKMALCEIEVRGQCEVDLEMRCKRPLWQPRQ